MDPIIHAFDLRFTLIYMSVALFAVILINEYVYRRKNSDDVQNFLLLFYALVMIVIIGTRDKVVGADSARTLVYFNGSRVIKSLSELKDVGTYFISLLARKLSDNYKVFFTINAMLYITPIVIGIRNLTGKNRFLVFFIVISMFFFKAMGINTTKQGIAFSFFFLAMTFYNKKRWLSLVFFTIAFFNHASIIIPIVVFFMSTKINNLKVIFSIYIAATVLSLVSFNLNELLGKIPIINILVEERLDQYYSKGAKVAYKTGFRANFFIFNTIFAVIGYYTLKSIEDIEEHLKYKRFYVTYMLTSAFFFLMFSAAFSDRFGVLSWIFIPFLMYPYTQTRNKMGLINMFGIFLLCFFLFLIFNLK
ncbi:EpsG family protein [Chryseobacterium sp. RU33C]|uniref:EpsG family protein n=1 Tax=Chryseobacterium sp. RU33C TaxID=1907398 RepID=UPI000954AE2B|nr:EpsG family protein [Chryseobacterium sp. RU33C]SIR12463.1 EpsG family protein [Chryseobacterium sp. RU33C]